MVPDDPAALPVQLFAYAAARARNLEPGIMRYLGWVVTGDASGRVSRPTAGDRESLDQRTR